MIGNLNEPAEEPKRKSVLKLILFKDDSCDMEKLELDGECLGFGNTHDNHCEDRFEAVKKVLDLLALEYVSEVNKNWKYKE